jgi:hypothetical protein
MAKLQVKSWDNTADDWNAEAEETAVLSYKIRHRFNAAAEAEVVIADTDGTKAQKYDVSDGDDLYLGPAYYTIEDPDATDVFEGRCVRARAN